MKDHWETDTPKSVDEALELLRFGAIQVHHDSEYPNAIARTERRMTNCADFLEQEIEKLRTTSNIT